MRVERYDGVRAVSGRSQEDMSAKVGQSQFLFLCGGGGYSLFGAIHKGKSGTKKAYGDIICILNDGVIFTVQSKKTNRRLGSSFGCKRIRKFR
jgi:hypothetical protein